MADNAVDIDLHHLIPFGRPAPGPKKVIIVHTTENTLGTSAKNIIDYQVRTESGSYHRLVDSTGKITLANTDDWQVWATGNKGNDMALHVSVVWQAKTTRKEWLAQPQILDGVARVIAYWSRTYGVPLVKLSRNELGAGKHGVAGHLEAQVWGNTDHWDPGYHFPYDVVLEKARKINAGEVAPKPAQPATQAPVSTGGTVLGGVSAAALNDAKVAAQSADAKLGTILAWLENMQDQLDEQGFLLNLLVDQDVGPGRDADGIPTFSGWPQLGQDVLGRNLTRTDSLAALRHEFAELSKKDANTPKESK